MSLEIKTGREFDVIGMGSALLDFIFEVSDDVLADLGLKKGEMHLIDEEMSMAAWRCAPVLLVLANIETELNQMLYPPPVSATIP